MKYSIIIPAYNAEDSIENCVNSVLQQEVINIEIIIINDGSTDKTIEICNKIAKKDTRIKVFNQNNRGVSYSRRRGLSLSTGDYCIFLDSDDFWDKNLLKQVSRYVGKYDLIIFNFKRVHPNGNILYTQAPLFSNEMVFGIDNKLPLYEKIAEGTEMNNLVTKLFKKDIYIEQDYPQFYEISNGEDLLEVLPLIKNANKIIYLDKSLYNYVFTTNSLSNAFNPNYYQSLITVRQEIKKIITSDSVMNDEIDFKFHQHFMDKLLDYVQNLFRANISKKSRDEIINNIMKNELFKVSTKKVNWKFRKRKNLIIYYLLINKYYKILSLFSYLIEYTKNIYHRIKNIKKFT